MANKSAIFYFQSRDLKKKIFSRLLFLIFLYLIFSVQRFYPVLAEQLLSYWSILLILFLVHILVSYFKIRKLSRTKIQIQNETINYLYNKNLIYKISIHEIQEIRNSKSNSNSIIIIGKKQSLTLSYLENQELFIDKLFKINNTIIVENMSSGFKKSVKEKLPLFVSFSLIPSIFAALLHFTGLLNAVYFFIIIFANIVLSFFSYYIYLIQLNKKELFSPYKKIFIISFIFLILSLLYLFQLYLNSGTLPPFDL